MTAIEFNLKLLNLEDGLSHFASKLTSDKEDAKDLLQETMLKALVYKDHFEDDTNMRAWSYTIMKNTFINSYRKNAKKNLVFSSSTEMINQGKDTLYDLPDSIYETREISKIIENLEDMFKVPFILHTEGYKYKEISEKLNLNLGTVKSRIFFARKKLMNALEK